MSHTVLVIESDPTVLDQLCVYVKEAEFRVQCATNLMTAMGKLRSFRLPIVIVDWELPNREAPEIIRQIRENHRLRRTHVLVLSSQTSPKEIQAAMKAGADDYFTKPVGASELRNRLIWAGSRAQAVV
ncbi:MAG: response regulator [Pirellulaceae bacterium]|nr:response regulator [Pirellulaceae bacterium]